MGRRKKKTYTGLVIWLILCIILLGVVLVLLFSEFSKPGVILGNTEPLQTAPRNLRDRAEFAEVDGRMTYPGAVSGIDVSEHQQEIDWTAVKNDGIDFAIIRMGFRGSSKGGLFVDERFYENLNGAQDAGIEVGVYFYSQANSVDEAVEEAEYVLAALSGYTLQHPVFYDWEEGTPRSERLQGVTMSDVTDFSAAFCSRIEEAGFRSGVYFNQKYGYSMKLFDLQNYAFWLAEFNDAMTFGFDASYWQYTYQGTVDGISTAVDLDLYYPPEEPNEENH